ncbi:MAG: hypothetical protein QM669_02390 [Siphonobacter sp.]
MKPSLLFRLFNVFMVFIVLMTSTGFGLVEHTCHVRNKKKITFITQEEKSCSVCISKSGNSQHTVLKKQKCCEEKTRYEHVSYTSSLTKLTAKFIKIVVDFAATVSFLFVQAVLSIVLQTATTDSSQAAVPLSGRELLSFVQSYLI